MTYAVIGLGKFGSNVAKGLLKQNVNVIIIDKNEKMLNEFKNIAHELYILDSTDVDALRESGISNVDTAIVSIGENVESNILTVMALKEAGVKEIIAKSITLVHGKILSKIGVSRIIYPERDSARRLVKSIVKNPACDIIEATNTLRIARFNINSKLLGLSVKEVLTKMKNSINIIALKANDSWNYHIKESDIISEDKMLIIGLSSDVEEFIRIYDV